MRVLTDCRYYRTNVPCRPHKESGVNCENCTQYSPVDSRILIVKLGSLGDVVRTTSCLKALKDLYPRSHITWVTRHAAKRLLAMNPWIDRVLTIESNYLELLLCEEFDLACCPDADILAASILRLVRARSKRGFTADGRGGVTPLNSAAAAWWRMGVDDVAKRANRRTYGEWLYDICDLPTPAARPYLQTSADARKRVASLFRQRAPHASRWVCFNTGASSRWQEKRWNVAHYRDLAHIITRNDPNTAIALAGGSAQKELNRSLSTRCKSLIDCGTGLSIEDFTALIEACDWILTPDSLAYHVASAVGTQAVCVVGPTAPWELDTYGTNRVLFSDLDCIGCYRAQCPFAVTCMDRLTAELVWAHMSGEGVTGVDQALTAISVPTS
jgi:heptosyltransferase-2